MNELTFRAVLDDGQEITWEQPLTLPDGTVKAASIDDIDRSVLSNLLTVDHTGKVLHALGFPKDKRSRYLAVWRLTRKMDVATGIPVTVGALAGYNELLKDGTTKLTLFFIDLDGTVSSGEGFECQLHPREVFSVEEAEAIMAEQQRQNELAQEDALAIIPEPEPVTTTHGDSI